MLTLTPSTDGPRDPVPADAVLPGGPAGSDARRSGDLATKPARDLTPRPASGVVGWVARWIDGWWAVALRGPSALMSVLTITLLALATVGFFSIPAAGVGLLMLVPAIWGFWGLGRLERHVLRAFTGTDIGPPAPGTTVRWRRALGLDQPRLQAVGWGALQGLWGLLAGAIVLGLLTQAVSLVIVPFIATAAPDGAVRIWLTTVQGPVGYAAAVLVGLALLVLVPFLARGLAMVDVALGRWLLGVDPQRQLREMSQRVDTLTTTREETIDSVEAERRRIERDLHDGPQQRLVSIAMTLGLAQTQLDRDPEAARALLDEAHAASKEAITEMRQVARGIVPPILADRGLDAAVSALADRSPVPVTVNSRLHERLDPTIEAIAYFCVSESLTNIAKHAGARRATVDLGLARTLQGDRLAITVTDDGAGGAVVGAGSGLTGLKQRVASVDGDLHVHSPVGGGTTVAITLPVRGRRNA
ncbi:sensor histidine kinase [Ornithinimicrobium panacihumi]|uniref:sensor histidine kinase n=1 Tax=Ornithinimicrobium panacihumi TaxID=2008449 RepID=UPI003F8C62B2